MCFYLYTNGTFAGKCMVDAKNKQLLFSKEKYVTICKVKVSEMFIECLNVQCQHFVTIRKV